MSRLFYNNVVFAVQRRLYHLGIPFSILPIRVKARGCDFSSQKQNSRQGFEQGDEYRQLNGEVLPLG